MKHADPPLDHDTLAAYISNTLPPEERAAVTRALLHDPDARELLALAARALGGERDRLRDQVRVGVRDRESEKGESRRTSRAERKSQSSRR